MKVCIVYVGSYNLFDLCKISHNRLFNLMKDLNINYDVYISVANEILLSSSDKDMFYTKIKKIKDKLQLQKFIIDINKWGNSLMYNAHQTIDKEKMKNEFEKIIGKDNLKYFDATISFDKELSEKIKNNQDISDWESKHGTNGRKGKNVHLLPHFFQSAFYLRIKKLHKVIDQNKYDKCIVLRPDFEITISKDLIKKYLLSDKINNYLVYNVRLDFFHISNKLFYIFFNENIYKNVFEADKIKKEGLYSIVQCSPYEYFHFEIYKQELYKKINIEYLNICFGTRQNLNNVII